MKHYGIYRKPGIEVVVRYLCNEAVGPRIEKLTRNKKKVTCKNCKRMMKVE